jgi:hypothetical protein
MKTRMGAVEPNSTPRPAKAEKSFAGSVTFAATPAGELTNAPEPAFSQAGIGIA